MNNTNKNDNINRMNNINNINNLNNNNSSNQINSQGFNMQYFNDNLIGNKKSKEKWISKDNKSDPFSNLLSLGK